MVSPVVGCTIGIVTCWKLKDAVVPVSGQSFVGVYISGEFAHTHSVRKLIASWLIIFCNLTPPLIGMKFTFRMCVRITGPVSVTWQGGRQELMVGVAGVVGTSMWRRFPILMLGGTPPGTLLRVSRECVCFVFFNFCGAVRFSAVMMGEASVIRVNRGNTLCFTLCSSTILSTLCLMADSGCTYGCRCMSPWGSNHLWGGAVIVRALGLRCCVLSLLITLVRTRAHLFGGKSCNVVTSSSITSCKCSFYNRKGTWQCCGNNLADPEIQYACVSGTK